MKPNNKLTYLFLVSAICAGLISCTAKTKTGDSGPLQSDRGQTEKKVVYRHGDLTRATVQGDLQLVRELIRAGGDIEENTSDNPEHRVTPLMAAVVLGHSDIAFEFLRLGAETYSRYDGFSSRDFALYNQDQLSRSVRDALAPPLHAVSGKEVAP